MTVSRTICLGFLAVISVGTLLLSLPICTQAGITSWQQFAEHTLVALFTATSATCVTGHIVVDTPTYFSSVGHVIILLLIQIGGLGYMTATTFLLLLLGRRFRLRDKIAIQQALDRDEIQGTTQVLKSIVGLTLMFEIVGAVLLAVVFAPKYGLDRALWLGIFHSVSAWNNAGFSLFSDSLIGYQGSLPVNLIIPGLIIFGGIGYDVLFESYLWLREKMRRRHCPVVLSLNFKVATTTTLILLGVGTIALLLVESRNQGTLAPMDLPTRLMSAWFLSVTPRTAGFNSIDYSKMTQAGLFLTIALMIIGGSPGGTAGGIKTTTVRILSSCTKAILQGRESVTLYDRQIPQSLILKAVGVTFGSLTVVILMVMIISISDPELAFIQIVFEVVSGYFTVGLSTGVTLLPTFSIVAKLALIITMYIGRVGILLLISALVGDPKPTFVRYPEENMLVG
jgi:trk system potassium uptake protein TrkH